MDLGEVYARFRDILGYEVSLALSRQHIEGHPPENPAHERQQTLVSDKHASTYRLCKRLGLRASLNAQSLHCLAPIKDNCIFSQSCYQR